jgi:hypothetical protein
MVSWRQLAEIQQLVVDASGTEAHSAEIGRIGDGNGFQENIKILVLEQSGPCGSV